MENLSWLWGSLIGVFATLLGTFFGWLLSKPKNKNIRILLNRPMQIVENRAWMSTNEDAKGQLIQLELLADFIFYNPSDNIKMMRNIRLSFYDNSKKELFTKNVSDLENCTTIADTIRIPNGIDAINIAPKVGELYKCNVTLYKNEFSHKDSISKILLVFDDENDKRRTQQIAMPKIKDIQIYKKD